MALSVDLFWSFRSPYSYLATPRLVQMHKEYDFELQVRPVLPLAVRDPGFFDRVNPMWPPYLMRDTMRIAEFYGIDYGWPRPDPIVQDFVNRTIPKEQPYIHRLTRLGIEACRQGKGLSFINEVSQIIWNGKIEGWNEGRHLADASARAGLDLAALEAVVEREAPALDAIIAKNQEDHLAAGHWGVPTMVFEGEPFFGQDRLDILEWRMQKSGLRRR